MATHDYFIDNSTGANVRADINSVLKAILTNNSGTTDPATVISTDAGSKAFSFWADTNSSPAVLKIRNAADNAWIELFQLDGTLTLEDGSASTPALAFRDDLNTGIFSSAADTFDIATAGSKRLIVDSVGRVGIGNITPVSYNSFANTLVVATSTNTGLTLSGNDASANYSGIQFSAGTTVRAYVDQQLNSTGRMRVFNMANGFLEFGTNNEVRMHIKATGEVGIGTSSIDRFVHIEGTDNVLLKLQNNQTVCLMEFQDTDTTSGNRPSMGADGNSAVFYTGGAQKMALDQSGRLLIGVGSSAHASTNADDLCVGNNDSSSEHGITIGSNNAASIRFADSASGSAGIINYSQTYDQMTFYTGGNLRMMIDGSGNIGAPTGTNIYNASDSRLKKNVVDLDKGLSAIKSLRPVSFNWIDGFCDEEKQTLYGFIAQEVETIDRNLIQEFGNGSVTVEGQTINDALRVNEKLIIPMLVKAVQELEAKVAALKSA